MATACEKYQYLVVGPDGQTVADPYGMVPTLGDLEEWKEVARRIFSMVETELGKTGELGAVSEELGDRYDGLAVRLAELPSAWSFGTDLTYGPAILQTVQVAQDAACLLGDVEAELQSMGGTPDPKPAPGMRPGKSGKGTGKGLGLGLVVLGALYYFSERRRG